MFRAVRNWIAPSGRRLATRRPGRSIAIEPLEDRTLPSFVSAPSFPVGPKGGERSNPMAVATGDFNRDGKMDVATANNDSKGISLLLGLGNGAFRPSINVPIG